MKVSARNRLPGVVTSVVIEGLLAQVELKVGDNHVVALISAEACRELDLKVGDPATALVKSTSVMVVRDLAAAQPVLPQDRDPLVRGDTATRTSPGGGA